MSELRQNMATREWFVIATERAKRPHDFSSQKRHREDYKHSDTCPFCPGNEHMTPTTAYKYQKDGSWFIRSVPNKFSAFSKEGDTLRKMEGIFRTMNGVGIHEVIIESPIHNDHYTTMPVDHIAQVIKAYQNRFLEALDDERVEAVIIFKNYGPTAGCSLAHPHSQMIAMPLVPMPMRFRLETAKRVFDDRGRCVFCIMMQEEMRDKVRIVTENDSFVVFCPFASGAAFETWIMPKRHNPTFGNISGREIKDLAAIMKDLFTRYYHGLNDPDFNFAIKTPPRDESNDRAFHWYIQVLPKLTKMAGFELGTGMLINVTLPEKNAEFLRNVNV